MASFYIKTKIKDMLVETETYKKKRRWFCWELDTRKRYFLLCEIDSGGYDAPLFKIPVTEDEFARLAVDDNVSVHIKARYQYSCLHFRDGDEKVQRPIIKI